MRKLCLAIVVGLVAMAALVPAGPAQAQSNAVQQTACATHWSNNAGDGYMWAWRHINCSSLLGSTQGNDGNWADSSGAFRGTDNDAASSVMNTGSVDPNGLTNVKFFLRAATDSRGRGGHTCLSRNEAWADNLTDNTFTSGQTVNDRISSHLWVQGSDCGKFVT